MAKVTYPSTTYLNGSYMTLHGVRYIYGVTQTYSETNRVLTWTVPFNCRIINVQACSGETGSGTTKADVLVDGVSVLSAQITMVADDTSYTGTLTTAAGVAVTSGQTLQMNVINPGAGTIADDATITVLIHVEGHPANIS